MKIANPTIARSGLIIAHEFAKHGVPFVVVPVTSDAQRVRLTAEIDESMKILENENDSQNPISDIGGEGQKVR